MLVVLCCGWSSIGQAQTLDESLALFQRGELEQALESFEALRLTGQNGPADVARIERHLGILYAAVGRDAEASRAFERSLSISPEQPIPQEIGPEQQSFFATVQRSREGRAVSIAVESLSAGRYRASATDAPEGWIARVVAEVGGDERTGDESVEFSPEPSAWLDDRVDVRLRALDEFGNTVAIGRETLTREPAIVEPPSNRGRILGLVLGGIALAAGGAGLGVWLARRDRGGFSQGGSVAWELRLR